MGEIPPSSVRANRERTILVSVLLFLAACFLGLAFAFRSDAAKAAPRIEKARTEGKWTFTKDYAAVGTWRFGLANAGILVALAAAAPWWHRRRSQTDRDPGPSRTGPPSGWFAPALGAIVLLAVGLRVPLACGGFWHDECLQATRIHGSYQHHETMEECPPDFRPAPWVETFFHFRKPTNHTAVAVPSRLCLEAWRALTGAPRTEFNELAMRIPSLLASAGSILLLGFAGRRWGRADIGLLAALLLAVHPWHVRWGVDMRAYSIGVFATCLALWSLAGALRAGGWRSWSCFGLAQFLLLWSSLLQVFLAAAFFVVAALWLWKNRRTEPMGPGLSRLFAANAVAAALFLQIMGPCLMQFQDASRMRDPADENFTKLDHATLVDTASNLLLGLPGPDRALPGDRAITTYDGLFRGLPVAGAAVLAAYGAVVLLGILALRRDGPAACLLGTVLAAAAVHLAATKAMNVYFYSRFLTYLLPVVALATAAAWTALAGKRRAWLAWIAAPVFTLAVGWPQLQNLLCYEHEPLRRVAAAVAAERAKARPDHQPVAGCYGLGGDLMEELYDPTIRSLNSRVQIEYLVRHADTFDHPLLIAYGLQGFNRERVPDGFELLDDRRLFEPVARFECNDPMHTFFLLRFPVAKPVP